MAKKKTTTGSADKGAKQAESNPTEGDIEAAAESDEDTFEAAADEVEEAELEEIDEDEELAPLDGVRQVEMLTALAMLDREAAAAYQAAAEVVDLKEVRDQLLNFREDHRRHIRDLSRLLTDRGAAPVALESDETGSLLRRLVEVVGPLGTGVALLNLIASEQLTNTSYEASLEFDWDDEALAVLQGNFTDEQRHLEWLADQEAALAGEVFEDQPAAPT